MKIHKSISSWGLRITYFLALSLPLAYFLVNSNWMGNILFLLSPWIYLLGAATCFYKGSTPKENDLLLGIASALTFAFLLTFFAACPHHSGDKARQIACASNLKQIGLGLRQYAQDNNGFFPPVNGATGLEFLRHCGYLTDTKIYTCPSTKTAKLQGGVLDESTVDYVYAGAGLTLNDSPDSPIAWDKAENHKDYGNILFLDGYPSRRTGNDWLKKRNNRTEK